MMFAVGKPEIKKPIMDAWDTIQGTSHEFSRSFLSEHKRMKQEDL